MALSEYMPYGAPELLDGARDRMARSMLFASLAVALLVTAVGVVLTHGGTTIPIDPGWIDTTVFLPPPLDPPPAYEPLPPVTPAPPRYDPERIPRPVPDVLAPPEIESPPAEPRAGDGGTGGPPAGAFPGDGHGGPPPPDPVIGVYQVIDVYPNLVTSVEPRYPDLAREAGVEGVVRVLMLVGLDGRVVRAVVAPGGSVPLLDQAALDAARGCVFTPALTNDHPVKVWVSRSYRFSLH